MAKRGSWKVAYIDLLTGLMSIFFIMWITKPSGILVGKIAVTGAQNSRKTAIGAGADTVDILENINANVSRTIIKFDPGEIFNSAHQLEASKVAQIRDAIVKNNLDGQLQIICYHPDIRIAQLRSKRLTNALLDLVPPEYLNNIISKTIDYMIAEVVLIVNC